MANTLTTVDIQWVSTSLRDSLPIDAETQEEVAGRVDLVFDCFDGEFVIRGTLEEIRGLADVIAGLVQQEVPHPDDEPSADDSPEYLTADAVHDLRGGATSDYEWGEDAW